MSATAGPKVAEFVERFCTLGGSYLGQPFVLQDWQHELLDDMYKITDDGHRRWRTYVLGVPRKNGKTQLTAALALYHLIADRANAAPQVVVAAGDREQARLLFKEAARMVMANHELLTVCRVEKNHIWCKINQGELRVVTADAKAQQGLNPSVSIIDEYHVHRNADLFDALSLGSGTRNDPLMIIISTAGSSLESPLGELYTQLIAGPHRRNGVFVDQDSEVDGLSGTWYGPEPGDDFDHLDPATWEKYNPNFALMNARDFAVASKMNAELSFVRYRLNGWVAERSTFLPLGAWRKLATAAGPIPRGSKITLGFDGSWRGDSTGLVACTVDEPHHMEVLGLWASDSPDWRVPRSEVVETISAACRNYNVVELAADPYVFGRELQDLEATGVPVVEFPTSSVARISPATEAFYRAVMDQRITHNGDFDLASHLSNAMVKQDARGIRITKPKGSANKIDLAVCAIIALAAAEHWRPEEPTPEPSFEVY